MFFICCEVINNPNQSYYYNRWVFVHDNGFNSDCKQTIFMQGDPLNYLRRAGILWERRVRKSLNSMCTELEVTLQGQPRSLTEKEELLLKWDELSNYQIGKSTFVFIEFPSNWLTRISILRKDLSNYRPVYAPKDLLEVLLSLKGPTRHDEE